MSAQTTNGEWQNHLQEIFNKVYIFLMYQDEKSQTGVDDRCMLRGEGNKKCAIGCLMQDSDYDPSFEHNNLVELYTVNNCTAAEYSKIDWASDGTQVLVSTIINHPEVKQKLRKFFDSVLLKDSEGDFIYESKTIEFLQGLQTIHDHVEVDDWRMELRKYANKYALSVPEYTKENIKKYLEK